MSASWRTWSAAWWCSPTAKGPSRRSPPARETGAPIGRRPRARSTRAWPRSPAAARGRPSGPRSRASSSRCAGIAPRPRGFSRSATRRCSTRSPSAASPRPRADPRCPETFRSRCMAGSGAEPATIRPMEGLSHRATAASRSRGRLTATLALTCGFVIVEVAGALWSGSLALLADAGHMLADASAGLAVNLVCARLLHDGAAASLNVRAAYLDVLGDALSSLGVVIAAVVVIVTGWTLADPLASGAIALVIVPRTWRLLRQAVNVLLEGTPAHLNLGEIEEAMRRVPAARR